MDYSLLVLIAEINATLDDKDLTPKMKLDFIKRAVRKAQVSEAA